ncbi:hypothetical protein COP1_003476 [Malus domestica]
MLDLGLGDDRREGKGCCIRVIQRVARECCVLGFESWFRESEGVGVGVRLELGLWNGAGLVTDGEGDEGVECQGDQGRGRSAKNWD